MVSFTGQNNIEMTGVLGAQHRQRDLPEHFHERELVGTSPLIPIGDDDNDDPAVVSSSRRTNEILRSIFPCLAVEWRRFGGAVLLLLLILIALTTAASINTHFRHKRDREHLTHLEEEELYELINGTELFTDTFSGDTAHLTEEILAEDNKLLEAEQTSQNQSDSVPTAKGLGLKLFSALYSHNETEAERLIKMGADVNVTGMASMTPLHFATLMDESIRMKVIRLLIENWADVYAMDWTNRTFLHDFVESYNFRTQIHLSHLKELAQLLISRNHTRLFNIPGNFPMEFTTRFRYICRMTTPFQLAVKNRELPMTTLRLIKDNGVDFNAVNSRGDSTLFYALVGKRTLKMIKYLVELGADWRHLNQYKQNMLHLAVLFGGVDEMKYFLGLGLNIDAVDRLGDTPLHMAVYYTTIDVLGKVKFLLENGANDKIRNGHGKIPLDDALVRDDFGR